MKTEIKLQHTPTPWNEGGMEVCQMTTRHVIMSSDGSPVAYVASRSKTVDTKNAAFIVRCTNNFDALLIAAKETLQYLPKGFRQVVEEVIAKAEEK